MTTTGSAARVQVCLDKITHLAEERLKPEQVGKVERFITQYYAHTPPEDLAERRAEDLYGAAMSHLHLARSRPWGEAAVQVYSPDPDRHGYGSPNSIVQIVTDDMPFLVDSLGGELTRQGVGLHLVIHPVLTVRRDEAGQLVDVLEPGSAESAESAEGSAGEDETGTVGKESYLRFEIDKLPHAGAMEQLRADVLRCLDDVTAAVTDWKAMRERASEIAGSLHEEASFVPEAERAEAVAFLRWLDEGHFVFLGYREYELATEDGEDVLRSLAGSGLGILRDDDHGTSHSYSKLPVEVRRQAREPNLLNLTKANSRSTVHRRSYLDYIGVKRISPDGTVLAERRFLGLYTTSVYKQWPYQIPILRQTVGSVLARAGFAADSHSGKALIEVLDSYPRDELFQMTADELFDNAMAILALEDRQRLRVLARNDQFGRFVSCLVFLPRDRLTPALENRIRSILLQAFHGIHLEQTTRTTESVLVRLHLVVYVEPGAPLDYDIAEVESQLRAAMRTWGEDLHDALVEEFGEERGAELYRRYGSAFHAAYIDNVLPRAAVSDIRHLEALGESGLSANLYRPIEASDGDLRLKVFRTGGALTLSAVLPVLENMGMQAVDERPYELEPDGVGEAHVYDFGVAVAGGREIDIDDGEIRRRFHDALVDACLGRTENDAFNVLVLAASLGVRDIATLRAYAKYMRQTGTTSGESSIAAALANYPDIARRLVELFHVRFDPDLAVSEDRDLAQKQLVTEIERGLDAVTSLNEDRILRRMLATVQATLRTNFFKVDANGAPPDWFAVKLDSRAVPDLPLPRPMFEAFVTSPRMEGIHLRGGWVARGGLRWSDRHEDYRTEILGLMKAQNVKNAVIVPVGAKGGFVVKNPPPAADQDALRNEGIECYRILIRGLLDFTDNLVGGKVVGPDRVVRHDGDDAYLVVAADKGTATFSDIANALSLEHGFWLGDAFASGGSAGYDHKAMGITARGAWVSVRRHLRDLGIDPGRDGFRAVGIGDMSGDVFGNGMLLEPNLSLLAAFDHRDVFLDPSPDPAKSFAERRRLFDLPRSSWEDYDQSCISPGGGVWSRSLKSIPVSPEVQKVLAIDADLLTPDELIQAILRAPVDLLFNGGIGTYVRASSETNAEVGDKTNDNVRIAATELRCRLIGEGGNLGLTQLGRIEYAISGGRIFTDAIDNSAGVDTSDHEVNIKILLDRVVGEGNMTKRQRDDLLEEMTDEVAHLVLADNEGQTLALTLAASQVRSMASVHFRFLAALERAGRLNRAVEYLPSAEELSERMAAGRGLTTPELSVLLAYSKEELYTEILASDLPDDAFLQQELVDYFPTPLRNGFAAQLETHALRREIIATRLTNTTVNLAGMTFAYRLADETGMPKADVVRAHAAAVEMFGINRTWAEIGDLENAVPAGTQTHLYMQARGLAERASRWLIQNRLHDFDIASSVARFSADLERLVAGLSEFLVGSSAAAYAAAVQRLVDDGVPAVLAGRIAGAPALLSGLDIVDIARASGRDLEETARVYFTLGESLHLDWVRDRVNALPRNDRWDALARAAVREDLSKVRAALTSEVLRHGSPGASAAQTVRSWLDSVGLAAARCLGAVEDIISGGSSDLATLSVALRQIRGLAEASSASSAGSAGSTEPAGATGSVGFGGSAGSAGPLSAE
jgi:glutamate dehydrogenase